MTISHGVLPECHARFGLVVEIGRGIGMKHQSNGLHPGPMLRPYGIIFLQPNRSSTEGL
ncbi:hypothetical protein [Leptodesmis sp.]|uniref:hypothetical protein n=1 Tax=Leptodesmis sp. TaxID=3100501 RepID=UPI0040535445